MTEPAMLAGIPLAIARRIGMATDDENSANMLPAVEPSTMMDHALVWASRGFHVFPAKSFIGIPLVENWVKKATRDLAQIMMWWSEWPDADIAMVPHLSDHFAIVAIGERGRATLNDLEAEAGVFTPDFEYENSWGDRHLLFKGRAFTSFNLVGPKVHVFGPGRFIYLPASRAPNADR